MIGYPFLPLSPLLPSTWGFAAFWSDLWILVVLAAALIAVATLDACFGALRFSRIHS